MKRIYTSVRAVVRLSGFGFLAIGFTAAFWLGAALATATAADDVPQPVQDLVIAKVGEAMMYPATARWVFFSKKPYPGGGQIVCGSVDAQNSRKKFLGQEPFFALIDDSGVITQYELLGAKFQDPRGKLAYKMKVLCGTSAN